MLDFFYINFSDTCEIDLYAYLINRDNRSGHEIYFIAKLSVLPMHHQRITLSRNRCTGYNFIKRRVVPVLRIWQLDSDYVRTTEQERSKKGCTVMIEGDRASEKKRQREWKCQSSFIIVRPMWRAKRENCRQ